LFEIDDPGLVADRLDQGGQTEVAGAAQEALGGANDQGQGVLGEGVVAQGRSVNWVKMKASVSSCSVFRVPGQTVD
jgi:hypothetical protein